MADIVLVNPIFDVSFWGLENSLPLFGKRANVPPASLPLLAALTPGEHQVTLMDEGVEKLDFDRLARADIVGITGMSVQRFRMREILTEVKQRGGFTVVGGPWVTAQEDYFNGLADVIFVGEAEETWPHFLADWQSSHHQKRYAQADRTDMTRVPVPRWDLLKLHHYMFGSLQFSRGCPFECEFCDIIVTFGRRPRLKTSSQVIAELDTLRAQRMEIVFVVDDNLIGNKKAIKLLLREVADWQQKNGFPIAFFTEASLDLVEDEELMRLMVEANIVSVFIGIESLNEASLRETRKFQNVRSKGGSMLAKVHTAQRAGLDVWCGMILGFDHDDTTIFAAQKSFIQASRIQQVMIGMLYAVPKTPLYDRLVIENRLDWEDESAYGTNVVPLQMSREELSAGYVALMRDVYAPQAYFDRMDALFIDDEFRFATARAKYWRAHWWTGLRAQSVNLLRFIGIYWRLMRVVKDENLRSEYRRRIARLLRSRRDPAVLFTYLIKCAVHYHHYTMATRMSRQETAVISTF